MKKTRRSLRLPFLSITVLLLSILACQSNQIFSTATPAPTQTPYPTYTPYPTVAVTPAPDEIFFEDFEGNSTCFEPFSDSNVRIKIESGVFSFNIDTSEQSFISLCRNHTFSDFTLEVDVSIAEDTGGAFYYGIVFRETGGQYYSFFISTALDGFPVYCASYTGLDSYIPLSNSTFDPGHCWAKVPINLYQDQWNTLRIRATGEIIQIYLNDEILMSTRDDILVAGRIGFITGTYNQEAVKVVYDNLRVTEP